MKVRYVGRADYRIIDASDIHKVDDQAEFRKTTFAKGEVVDVDQAAAAVLLEDDMFMGEFEKAPHNESAHLGEEHKENADDAVADSDVDLGDNEAAPEQSAGTTGTTTTTPTGRGRTATSARARTQR